MGKLQTILFKILRAGDITVTPFMYIEIIFRELLFWFFFIEKSSVRCHTFQTTKQRVILFQQEAQF